MRVTIQCLSLIEKLLDMQLFLAGRVKEGAGPGKIKENEQDGFI